jgi:hypothetical protein
MIELSGNIWDVTEGWICIPTNGIVDRYGAAVMGAGLAYQAKKRYPGIEKVLGDAISDRGNIPHEIWNNLFLRVWSFPTKLDWRQGSDLNLIKSSAQHLRQRWQAGELKPKVFLPQVGCGLGGLPWDLVSPILQEELPEPEFIVLSSESTFTNFGN